MIRRYFLADRPDKARQFAGDGCNRFVPWFAASVQGMQPPVQSLLCLPANLLQRFRLIGTSLTQSNAPPGTLSVMMRRLDQQVTHVAITAFTNRSPLYPLAAGILCWCEPNVCHELLGRREATEVTNFSGDDRGGYRRHTVQNL